VDKSFVRDVVRLMVLERMCVSIVIMSSCLHLITKEENKFKTKRPKKFEDIDWHELVDGDTIKVIRAIW